MDGTKTLGSVAFPFQLVLCHNYGELMCLHSQYDEQSTNNLSQYITVCIADVTPFSSAMVGTSLVPELEYDEDALLYPSKGCERFLAYRQLVVVISVIVVSSAWTSKVLLFSL